jgi:hypothetical protein
MTSGTRNAFLAWLNSQIGVTENPAGSNINPYARQAGHLDGQPWCATFLVAGALATGVRLPSASAYCPTMVNEFKRAGRFHTTPEVGDLAFFQFDAQAGADHVGVVESVGATTITTIEGNTSKDSSGSQSNGGGVFRRVRHRSLVIGYGRPEFTAETPSAPPPPKAVIVKAFSKEAALMDLYPRLFNRRVRVVPPFPTDDNPHAAQNSDDIGFGVEIFLAKASYVGKDRYETLKQALRGEGVL